MKALKNRGLRALGATATGALLALLALGCAEPTSFAWHASGAPVHVKLIAFNDFHGYLEPPGTTIAATDPAHPDATLQVPTGGAAELSTLVKQLAAQNPLHAIVGAGDMVGASPLTSGLFLDEPAIEVLNAMGLEMSSVGNHEFDRGIAELMRKQQGGCTVTAQAAPAAPCQAGHRFEGARFQYLAANVVDRRTGQPILPAYQIKKFQGQALAFIGVTLQGTGAIVSPQGIENVEFQDEATTVNALVAKLRGRGVRSFVLLIHQGAEHSERPGATTLCAHFEGAIVPILDRLDPDVSVVVSGHTHQAYVCQYNSFLVTSAASFGRLVTDIDLTIDPASGRIIGKTATNRVVAGPTDPGSATAKAYPPLVPDPPVVAIVNHYVELARPLAERPVGKIAGTLKRLAPGTIECSLGDVVADAQWNASRVSAGAELAFTNPGGLRTDLQYRDGGSVSYGAVFAAQPFGNALVTLTLTGAQIKSVLEQQWTAHAERPLFLQVSSSFAYAFDASRALGDRVLADTMRLGGEPILSTRSYRLTVNSFLAAGGDGFTALLAGRDAFVGGSDADALESYLASHSPLAVPSGMRITERR